MKTVNPQATSEQRILKDRRARPTSLLSSLRWGGRRKRYRRTGEGVNAYVDCPSTEVVCLVFFVVAASCLDAIFTLMHLQSGASEVNPAMKWLLDIGVEPFVYVKIGMTALGCWLLAIHQLYPLGLKGLRFLALAYVALLLYHGLLFLR